MSTNTKSLSSSSSEDDNELRRGPWTLEEDTLLIQYIGRHGEGRWNLLANRAGNLYPICKQIMISSLVVYHNAFSVSIYN